MLEKSNYYPGQKSDEEIMLFIRRYIVAYIKWIFIISAMIIIPLFIFIYMSFHGRLIINEANKFFFIIGTSAYSLLIMAIFITTWIDWYLDVTIVTKEHLINIKQDELFSRSVAEQSLLRVQDVSSRMEGFIQTFFKFGTVYVETAGEQPNFKMTDIPRPHEVASMIMQIHEELIEEHELGDEITEGIGMDRIKPLNNTTSNKSQDVTEEAKSPDDIKSNDDATTLLSDGEEKIITIRQPNKSVKQDQSQPKNIQSEVVKIKPVKDAKDDDFKIKRTVIDTSNDKTLKTTKNIIRENKTVTQSKPKKTKKDQNFIDGEIKEGEEIKF